MKLDAPKLAGLSADVLRLDVTCRVAIAMRLMPTATATTRPEARANSTGNGLVRSQRVPCYMEDWQSLAGKT